MAARLDYRWHLRTVMAGRGMFSTTDLAGRRGAAALRRLQEQGTGSALRPAREGPPASPPQRRRAACVHELLAPRPAELEALHEVREQPACRGGHRGRAGLPDLPARLRPYRPGLTLARPDRAARPGPPVGRRATAPPGGGIPRSRPGRRAPHPALRPELNAITTLTTKHVLNEDGRTLLRLGSRPIVLPLRWTTWSPGSRQAAGHRAAACSTSPLPGCSRGVGPEAR
jgi:hypothetical protein